MDMDQLIRQLQELQRRLGEMANDLGNLADPELVAVSEEADRLILQIQRSRMAAQEPIFQSAAGERNW
jgi:regulator of replication initiation timing